MSTLNEHKKKMGRPPVDSELVRARIQQPLLGRLDAYADSAGIPRAEAIRRLVETGLSIPNYGSLKKAAERSGQDIAQMIEQVIFVADKQA